MSELLAWKPEYAVGVPAVDHEHRELIDAINRMYEGMDPAAEDTAIEAALGEISSAIAAHFALEENIMRKAGYREYLAHKGDHEDLLEQLQDIIDHYTDDPDSGRRDLADRLARWFAGHFATFDARLHGELGV